MGTTATIIYKKIASMLAEKQEKPYSRTIHWVRCRLNFSLLRFSNMCLCRSHSPLHHPASPSSLNTMDLTCLEGRVPDFKIPRRHNSSVNRINLIALNVSALFHCLFVKKKAQWETRLQRRTETKGSWDNWVKGSLLSCCAQFEQCTV